jgi:excisionase family DNA binding protein
MELNAQAHKLAYRPSRAADLVDVSRTTMYDWIAQGKVRAVQINGQRRVPHEELVRLVDEAPEAA